jgi:hypothetical protein
MRERLNPEIWRAERARILNFCLDLLKPKVGHRLSMQQIFDEYQGWLKQRGHGGSKLSIDGFGRLFPKTYPRRTMFFEGEVRRCLEGWEIEE